MIDWIMKKIGYVSKAEAEKFDNVLVVKLTTGIEIKKKGITTVDGNCYTTRFDGEGVLNPKYIESIAILDYLGNPSKSN